MALQTEEMDARYAELDSWPTQSIVAAMYEGQLSAVAAVHGALDAIAEAVDAAVPALLRGGRMIYIGAGTSGRIGVQDGAELLPTFSWPAERVVFAIAGGCDALTRSVEGAEDDEEAGVRAIADAHVGPDDIAIAVAASGTTPFTVAALRAAASAGAVTIALANNADAPLFAAARHRILVPTGSEAIAGSTRMKAGTAQKVVLNLLSTAAMVKMGRVYRGLMVQLRATNTKLKQRAGAIVAGLAGCRESEAMEYVERADGDVKLAVLLARGVDVEQAVRVLESHGGDLRTAIAFLDVPRNG